MNGIYCYVDKETGNIVYIGKDSHIDNNIRHKAHMVSCNYNQQQINRVLQNNPRRYDYEVLLEGNISEKLLNAYEMAFIRRYDPQFNFTNGGDGFSGFKMSEEQKQKIGNALKGIRRSEEFKRKCRERQLGKKLTCETKKKLSEANKGKVPWNKGKILGTNKYATLVKYGKTKGGEQKYAIKMYGELYKQSICPSKLLDWFTMNYPKKILQIKIKNGR